MLAGLKGENLLGVIEFVMNVAIVTLNDSLYAPLYAERVLASLRLYPQVRVCWMAARLAPQGGGAGSQLRRRLNFYGWRDLGIFALLELKARLLGRLEERGLRQGRPHSLAALAQRAGLGFTLYKDFDSPAFLNQVRERDISVLLCIAPGQIFGPRLLAAAPHVLNLHSSLLPKHRGLAGLFWTMLEEDPKAGVSLHRISEKVDAGPILGQCEFPYGPEDSLHDMYLKAIAHGSIMTARALAELADGRAQYREMDLDQGSYNSWPGKAERRLFRKKGRRFFRLGHLLS
jgi:folate-dependent phosphoribosylglycinamide formyltransferase PurN